MKKIFVFCLWCSMMSLFACTDATRSKISGFGSSHKVELVNCDGTVTHSWISSGKVQSEANSDGYYFNEKGTGTLLEVSGNVIITQL